MAGKNDIRPATKVTLIDGTVVEIRPVALRKVRKLMKVIKGLETGGDELNDDAIDKMVEATCIVLSGLHDAADDAEAMEDLIDLRSFNELLGAAMGTDPNG